MQNRDTAQGSLGSYTYYAFISYKRADAKWAFWLKRQLQRYRLPNRTRKIHPNLTKRLIPIFLDKTNLTLGYLDEGLRSEVQSAKYLIVICSRAHRPNQNTWTMRFNTSWTAAARRIGSSPSSSIVPNTPWRSAFPPG